MATILRFLAIEPVNDYRGAGTTAAAVPHLIAFAGAYAVYAMMCVWYEYRESSAQRESAPLEGKPRNLKWDFLKLVLLWVVIALHTDQAVYGLGWRDLNKYHYLLRYNFGGFALSSFSFVSGVFSGSANRDAMKKMTCSFVGAAMLTSAMCDLVILVTPGDKRPLLVHDMTWYLLALCVWRWTVSPLFSAMASRSVPSPVTWTGVFCTCYCLAHGISFHSNFYWGYFAFWFYTPFFALGRCAQRQTWTAWLENKYLVCAAAGSLLLWCFALLWWEDLHDWNDVICMSDVCSRKPWPGPQSSAGLSAAGFADACRIFSLKAWLSFSVMWLIAAASPRQHALSSMLAGCGTRTIYGYVLHIIVHVYLGVRLGLPLIVELLPEWIGVMLLLVMCAVALFVWCSKLTQCMFSWMVEPLWILRVEAQCIAPHHEPKIQQSGASC